jgi:hypothetical protein
MPWFVWAGLIVAGGLVAIDLAIFSWPPSSVVQQGIIAGIQKQNPSLDVARMQAWLALAPARYAATTTHPSVTEYMDWVAVNSPAWSGGQPVTTSPLYNATYANSG